MIRLKNLLKELSESDIQRCLDKIQNKQFRLIGAGDKFMKLMAKIKLLKLQKNRMSTKLQLLL